ncbi:hypothetical protein ACH4UY_37395 [Streptomyces longwoodensis]|uniref:hypothetical protein n=1 Tax=Streptomyces longwoodensis TaxID=68231 RepID=UPI00378F254D
MRPTSLKSIASIAVALGLASPLWAGAAAAAPPITCTGGQTVTYNPGLKETVPQTVTYTAIGNYGACPINDGVVTVKYSEGGTVTNATCVAFPSTAAATLTWRLLNGSTQTSTVQVTGVEVDVAGATQIYTSVSTVLSGRYAGHLVNVTVAVVPDPANLTPCLTAAGLTKLEGASTLTIT